MSKLDKTLAKMQMSPRDWRIEQLEVIAKRYGINVRKTGGSHVIFEHADYSELVCVPAHRPIKPIYIKQFLTMINTITQGEAE